MCPACIASTAVMVAGAGSTRGILAVCIGRFRKFFRAWSRSVSENKGEMGDNYETLSQKFENEENVFHPLSMPYQHFDLFPCRRPKFGTLPQVWPKLKNWG